MNPVSCSCCRIKWNARCNSENDSCSLSVPNSWRSTTRDGSHIWHEYWSKIFTAKLYSQSFCMEAGNNTSMPCGTDLLFLAASKWKRRATSTPKLDFSPSVLLSNNCVMSIVLSSNGKLSHMYVPQKMNRQCQSSVLWDFRQNTNKYLKKINFRKITLLWWQGNMFDIPIWFAFYSIPVSFIVFN